MNTANGFVYIEAQLSDGKLIDWDGSTLPQPVQDVVLPLVSGPYVDICIDFTVRWDYDPGTWETPPDHWEERELFDVEVTDHNDGPDERKFTLPKDQGQIIYDEYEDQVNAETVEVDNDGPED